MPKSKRNKIVSLTQTDAKGREHKNVLISKVRECVDAYPTIAVLEYLNMRTSLFKDLRSELSDSRLFLGNNKVMMVALGRTPAEEFRPDLSRLSATITGHRCLLFSHRSFADLASYLSTKSEPDYPRSGSIAEEAVTLEAGPLPHPHNMVETFRQLGLPVDLKNGRVTLTQRRELCKKGDVLTPEQCKLLKHFEKKISHFRLTPVAYYSEGSFHSV